MAALNTSEARSGNIQSGTPGSVTWSSDDPGESLKQLLAYVESEADKAIAWYWRHKRWKARCSRAIQMSAIALTALAGIFPIVAYLLKEMKLPYPPEAGLWSSLFVGIAAALIGIDRAFGLSSGWTRYVLTASSIRKLLEEFRLDCVLLLCKSGQPSPDQVANVVQRAKDFRLAVEGAVFQETRDWATEFQNNVAQLEKDVKAQLENLKAQVDRERGRETAEDSGALELTVVNAQAADSGNIHVLLEGTAGKIADEVMEGGSRWVRIGVAPGQYKLTLETVIRGTSAATSSAVLVKPGEILKAEMSLPG